MTASAAAVDAGETMFEECVRPHRRRRPWLIGEGNPYGSDPAYALFPWPRQAAGNRLREILGLTDLDYLHHFERRNLLDRGKWSARRARESAEDLAHASRGAPLVLLGRRVAEAFGLDYLPFLIHADPQPKLILPHPSGRCRAWNDPRSAQRARNMLRELEATR